MSVSFDVGFSGETKVAVHSSGGVEVGFHPKNDTREEFMVVECYDSERKIRVQLFVSGSGIDTLVERAGVVAALRFKEQK